jgi:hypothetical protein
VSSSFLVRLSEIRDLAGNLLVHPDSTFTTARPGVDETGPVVVGVSPGVGAVGAPVNARVRVVLSEAVEAGTVPESVGVSVGGVAVSGTATLDSDRRTVTWTATGGLPAGAAVQVTVSGLRDTTGNVMVPFTSGFTTATSSTPDTTAPAVVAMTPAPGAVDVPVSSRVVVTFSEPLDPTTVTSGAIGVGLASTGMSIPGTVALSGAVVTWTPVAPLPGSTTVRVTLGFADYTSVIRDLAGNQVALGSSFVGAFATAAELDTTPPVVTAVTPGTGATDVGPTAPVVVTFSEPLDVRTITDRTFALFAGSTRLSASVAWASDGQAVTLRATLPAARVIAVVATRGVTDLSGNPLADFRSEFTTAPTTDTARPQVVRQRPGPGAGGVPTDAGIVLFVDRALNAATVEGAVRVSENGVVVNGDVAVTGNGQVIRFTPAEPWAFNALIQVFLDATAVGTSGSPAYPYTGTFRTVADPAASGPTGVRVTPPDGSPGVPLNAVIEMEYSEALDPGTLETSKIRFYPSYPSSGAEVVVTATLRRDRIVRLTPSVPLTANTRYYCYLNDGAIRDLQGMASQYASCSFTTGATADTSSPQVVSVSPPDGAADVPVNANLRVRFDEPVNPLTVDETTIRVTGTGSAGVPYTLSFAENNTDVQIVPLAPLPEGAPLTLAIAGVEDLAGNVVAPRTTRFGTSTGPDFRPLALLQITPPNGVVDVPVNAVVTLEFNKPVDPLSVTSGSFPVYDEVAGGSVAGSYGVSGDGRTVTFVPDAPFAVGRTFQVSYRRIQDLGGNPAGTGSYGYESAFSVAFTPDTGAPQVAGVSPENGLTVPINAQVWVAFDEPVRATALAGVTLRAGGVAVPVSRLLSNGHRTLQLSPPTLLIPGTLYTVTIAGIQDLAGNPQGTPVVVHFTTEMGADLVAPTVGVTPANGATDVGTNAEVTLRFSEAINPLTVSARLTAGNPYSSSSPLVAGTITISADRRTATFTPTSALAPATTYYLQLGITDLAANALVPFSPYTYSNYSSFTTAR